MSESGLEEKVAASLAKLNSSDDDYDSTLDEPEIDDESTTEDSSAEANDDSSTADDDANSGDTDDTTEKPDGDEDANTEAGGDSDSDVPDAYMRAAEHQGWKKEEVEEFWKDDQEKAERTLSKILESTNKLSAQWGQLGQQQMGVQTQAITTEVSTTQPTAPTQSANDTFAGLDIAKLKTEYDDDNLIDDVIKPMNNLLAKMDAKLKAVEGQQTQTSQSAKAEQDAVIKEKKEAVGQQIDGFFNSLTSKEHKNFYGSDPDILKVDGVQAENRIKLLTQADQIKIGANYQAMVAGKTPDMTNETAMNLANLIISADLAEQRVISDIKNSLTKREKGLSLKPSGSRASSANDTESPKSGKALERKVEAFMKKRGIKQY